MNNIKFEVRDLDLYYGEFKALKNVNLQMQERRITAFIGPFRLRQIHLL